MSTPTFPSQPPDPEAAFAAALDGFAQEHVEDRDVRALSDLDRGSWRRLRVAWPNIGVETRREIASRMGIMSREHVDLAFARALRVGLDDDDATVRQIAVSGLWEDTGEDVAKRFIELARDDESADVRAEAARGLGHVASRAVRGEQPEELGDVVYDALYGLVVDPMEPLPVRAAALEAIGVFGGESIHDLIEFGFESDETELQAAAVAAMARSMDSGWLETVLSALSSREPELRREAAVACGVFGEAQAVADLAQAATDPIPAVRRAALQSLGEIGGRAATRVLEHAAEDEEYPDQELAAAALGALLDDRMLS